MPLIDLNKNKTMKVEPQSQDYIEGVSGTKLKLDKTVNILKNEDGVKEFSTGNFSAPSSATNQPIDISASLDKKLNNTTAPATNVPVQNLESKTYTLSELLSKAIQFGASDIHLSEGYRAIIRVDGDLKTIPSSILTADTLLSYAKEFISDRKDINLELTKQVDLGYFFGNRRFRVNIFKSMGSFTIACRLIPLKILAVEELGLPSVFNQLGTIANGLILVTGPTGSGKSTTIASILNYINSTQPTHIVTLEDPVEFIFPKAMALIDQREFGQDFSDWPGALRSLLRQDPNVVLVGEMRDLETIASTITVAETGHLVFATLHTNSASQSIDRMIDVFPEAQQSQIRAQLANVIVAVVSQRLVQLANGGRRAVIELMIGNSAIKNAIREGKTYQIDNMIQTGQDIGMLSMEKSLADLVRKGSITLDEARSTTAKQAELELYLKK